MRKTTESADASQSEGMEWSFEGALLRVEKGETQATRFTYDAGGNRVQALTRDGAKMSAANYLVDENTAYAQVLEERDSSGTLQARYVYGQGYGPILLQRRQKNSAGVEEVRARYLLADGHGSVRQLVTESGVVTDSYFYDAWGGGLSGGSGNTVNPYRYNGQQMDEATGGYYLRARYYQPGNGRFLGHDPLFGNNDDPVSLHRYLYAGGDGVNFVDPEGLSPIGERMATLQTQLTLFAINNAGTIALLQNAVAFGTLIAAVVNPEFRQIYVETAIATGNPAGVLAEDMSGAISLVGKSGRGFVNLFGGRILGGSASAVAASSNAEAQAMRLSQDEFIESLRRIQLGVDDATSNATSTAQSVFRPYEAELALRIEARLGRQIQRVRNKGAGDWVSGGKIYDAVQRVPGRPFAGIQSFNNSITAHFRKSIDVVVIDYTGFTAQEAAQIRAHVVAQQAAHPTKQVMEF